MCLATSRADDVDKDVDRRGRRDVDDVVAVDGVTSTTSSSGSVLDDSTNATTFLDDPKYFFHEKQRNLRRPEIRPFKRTTSQSLQKTAGSFFNEQQKKLCLVQRERRDVDDVTLTTRTT